MIQVVLDVRLIDLPKLEQSRINSLKYRLKTETCKLGRLVSLLMTIRPKSFLIYLW